MVELQLIRHRENGIHIHLSNNTDADLPKDLINSNFIKDGEKYRGINKYLTQPKPRNTFSI